MSEHGLPDRTDGGRPAAALDHPQHPLFAALLERRIIAWHRSSVVGRWMAIIPGIGSGTPAVIAAAVPQGSD